MAAVTAIVVTEALYGEAPSKAIYRAKFGITGISDYAVVGDDFDIADYLPPGYTLLGVVNCKGDSTATYDAVYNATTKKLHWFVKTTGVEAVAHTNLSAQKLSFLVIAA